MKILYFYACADPLPSEEVMNIDNDGLRKDGMHPVVLHSRDECRCRQWCLRSRVVLDGSSPDAFRGVKPAGDPRPVYNCAVGKDDNHMSQR